jgi:dTDP-4-amino-4,6-dideoxy-D-galactose acyltransferase
MNSADTECCNYLEWDSAFFGVRIGRVAGHHIDDTMAQAVECWSEAHQIDCLYFCADAKDVDSLRIATSIGFELIDLRLTLEYATRWSVRRNNPPLDAAISLRDATADDLPALQCSVVANHTDSRFNRDPRFGAAGYRRLYIRWIERECGEAATRVFVATCHGVLAGYITCTVAPDGAGSIGLSGVNGESRCMGVGTALLERALLHFDGQQCSAIRVVTQGANIPAQRLYTSNGFYPVDLKLWYHRWFNRAPVLHGTEWEGGGG